MIKLRHTPQMTGVRMTGDSDDFERLYDALHTIVGTEQDASTSGLYDSRIHVLSLCYDLRHARMGHRSAEFQEHGLDVEQMKFLSIVGSTKNLYLSFETFWPELLYITFVLNEFIYDYQTKKQHLWDIHVPVVRAFQHDVLMLIQETVTQRQFATVRNTATNRSIFDRGFYITMYRQYPDYLNMQWCELSKEERIKKLSIFAKRVTQHTTDYEKFEQDMNDAADYHGVSPDELEYGDYDNLNIKW